MLAAFRESHKKVAAPGETYRVKTFAHGLWLPDAGPVTVLKSSAINDVFNAAPIAALPPPVPSDLPDLPPRDTWVNIRSLGEKGDGATDDTDAFRKAVATHRAIYVPSGKYIISDTISLKPDTSLIGLHPSATQLILRDSTPAFQGVGGPKAMIEAPKGGSKNRDRDRALHQRHQPASRRREVDGGRRIADE